MKKNIFVILLVMMPLLNAGAAVSGDMEAARKSFIRTAVASYSPNEEVTDRFIAYSDYGRANDVLLLQLYMSVKLPDNEVMRLIGLFDREGFWKDIDYDDKTRGRWQPTLHLTRMYALAKHYADPDSGWYKDVRLHDILHKGIAWWGKKKPYCPNWWHNDIGAPKKLTAVLLMMYDELSDEEVEIGLKVLERSKFGRTGQNKAWLAGNNLMKGLLTNDEELVIKARDQIAEEIVITDEEGIQKDWSFHQHGPQIQFGNYGLAYAEGLSFWFRVLDGTPYMFTDGQRQILEKMILDGICMSVWNGVMDPSFCGRQVFINGGRGKAFSLSVAAQNMAALKGPSARTFKDVALNMLIPGSCPDKLAGPRYFWRSDCGIYRAADWYASIRMHSLRTIGFEYTNNENLLANFSADGALLLMQHGREYDNIFAYWDWRKIPGTTTYEDGKPIRCPFDDEGKKNRTGHVGGMTSGNVMCTTMEIERDGLHALKSNFFFDDLVVALGSDIRSSNPEITRITTSVDQNHLATEVKSGAFWAHHDGKGYVSLDGQELHVETGLQSGKWYLIDPFYKDRTEEGNVFKCYFEHDPSGTGHYAYALLPGRNAAQTSGFASSPTVEILRNDASCQAVAYKGTVCAVFHVPGEYRIGTDTYTVLDPSIYIVRGGKKTVEVLPYMADPSPDALSFAYGTPIGHPRLIMLKGEEEKIARLIGKDPDFKKIHNGIIAFSDSILGKAPVERVKVGKRMLAVSREALQRIFWLSYSYRMTSDARYAERAREEIMAVCAFEDWNPSHFLDTGEMGMAVAIGLDWLYDVLSPSDRETITAALDRHLFQAADNRKDAWFYNSGNNWNQVCNAGMVYAAIAAFGHSPARSIAIIEKSIVSNRKVLGCYAPDGGYPEGFGYWGYGTSFQVMMTEALLRAFGSDADICRAPGFLESAYFMQFMSAPSGKGYNYSDIGEKISCNVTMPWFAGKLEDNTVMWTEGQRLDSIPETFQTSSGKWFAEARLLPAMLVFASAMEDCTPQVPDGNVWTGRGETPVFIWRGGWQDGNDGYFAIKGGSPSTSHAHMDAGSFVYEYKGARWSSDLGSQNYFSLESKGVDLWGQKQESGRWDVFRIDNISHSTITLDGRHHRVDGRAEMMETFQGRSRKGASVNLTSILGTDLVKKAMRTVYVDNKGFLHVEDEIEAADKVSDDDRAVSVQWNMVTVDSAAISGKKSIDICSNGIRMRLSVKSRTPVRMHILSNEPPHDYDAPNPGTCRVGFTAGIARGTSARFRVSLREVHGR
ncbi:MAG: heparinase II/III family protein [Clostridium sp.]|nr:heparinase II/III family protein [Bacteroides sp.]MCM1198578.1 heparinase II/III family protein [Clostridium sp.]